MDAKTIGVTGLDELVSRTLNDKIAADGKDKVCGEYRREFERQVKEFRSMEDPNNVAIIDALRNGFDRQCGTQAESILMK